VDHHRRILLYGDSLILGSVGAVLGNWREFDVIALSPPLPGLAAVAQLAPDAVIFDIETTRPETVLALLDTQPSLLLLGISPDGNVMRLWSGRELREVSGKDLKDVIEGHLAHARPSHERNEQTQ
jgi:hypothetical protein